MIVGRRFALLAVLLALLWPPPLAAAAQTRPLRLCADPDNLPFSSSNSATPGIYIELGRRIAAALGRPFEPVWIPTEFGDREVHRALAAGSCDGFLGVPDDPDFAGSRIILSKPIIAVGYALVTPRATTITSLADLAGRRVAVQFGSPPQNLLAEHDEIRPDTVTSPEEGMRDLAHGTVDAAFIWGPLAGWINRSELHDAYKIIPVAGPHLQWQAAIGFPRDRTDLRDAVNGALSDLGGATKVLLAKYGFPAAAPQPLAQPSAATAGAAAPPAEPKAAAAAAAPKPADNAGNITAGHGLFNGNCEHCHGPDAVEGVRERNLRLLHHRYGDKMDQVFLFTVTHGRPAKGMPNWSGILTPAQFQKILAYLHSIQSP